MRRAVGGLWFYLADLDVDRVNRIVTRGSQCFTVAIPSGLLSASRSTIALLSLSHKTIDYIAVVSVVSRSSDLEAKAQIGPVVALESQAECGKVIASMPSKFRQYVAEPTQRVVSITPKTWAALLSATLKVAGMRPDAIKTLEGSARARSVTHREALPSSVRFERDAVALALEAYGGNAARKTYISSSVPVADAPFVNSLRHTGVRMIEDSAIIHDIVSFPGLDALIPCLVGGFQLHTERGVLTVLNANRTRVERTLGVDLVYYNHEFDSFVLVQYKRMTGDASPGYRPRADRNLRKELRRMREFAVSQDPFTSYDGYRLLRDPFYLKLCSPSAPGDWGGRMLPGMYFPIGLWDLLLASPASDGQRGGKVIGFDNAKRRFTNSQFARLLEQGWIGTVGADTVRVSDLISDQLDLGHSVIAASHEPRRLMGDYARDSQGRFAEDSDESAT